MAERSLRTRIQDSASSGRNYAESLHWGIRWESIRSQWFSASGHWADAEDAMACKSRLQREYATEVGEPFDDNSENNTSLFP